MGTQLGLPDAASKLGNITSNGEMGIPRRKCWVIWIESGMEIIITVDKVMY